MENLPRLLVREINLVMLLVNGDELLDALFFDLHPLMMTTRANPHMGWKRAWEAISCNYARKLQVPRDF